MGAKLYQTKTRKGWNFFCFFSVDSTQKKEEEKKIFWGAKLAKKKLEKRLEFFVFFSIDSKKLKIKREEFVLFWGKTLFKTFTLM